MNRLSTRLLVAMIAVALLALTIVPVLQTLAARQTFNQLETDFRDRVFERTDPDFPRRPHRDPPFNAASSQKPDDPFLSQENDRLFTLLSNYRNAQRNAILFGSLSAVLLAVALALWLTRSIAKPIEAVSRAAASLSDGNLATRVDLNRSYSKEALDLARDFNKMASSLEHYEGERQAMIADIAHELRTPLTTIQFRLDALEDHVVEFSPDEITLLKGQVGLLSRLIDDLRTLSLAEAGRLSFNVSTIDLSALVKNVAQQFQSKSEHVAIRLSVYADAPVQVQGDSDRLIQILNNLLDNAFKVTPSGGYIEVSMRQAENQVMLSVRDSGSGIPEDELESVFERFVQGKRRDTRDKGSGLGLAIVKSLVMLHGGSIKAFNHSEGAQFDVMLPVSTLPLNS
jgi:two-component system, OmpR family, sensor histidine kinase BaeS